MILSPALQEAGARLKAQEQAMTQRAAASDNLRGQIADSLTAGLLVVDGGGAVEVLNPAGRRLLEVASEPVGVPYQQVLGAASPLAAVIAECLRTGKPIVRRSVEMPPDMTTTHLGVTVSPYAGATGTQGAICLFSDLTAVVELEEQLRLKETLARLGEMTAGVAHGVRNGPATPHGSNPLVDPGALPANYRPYVEGIRQDAHVLGQVVTNFLNFARPQLVSLAPVDPGRIARRAADDLQHELPAGATHQRTGGLRGIKGEGGPLPQVVGHPLRNAAHA